MSKKIIYLPAMERKLRQIRSARDYIEMSWSSDHYASIGLTELNKAILYFQKAIDECEAEQESEER